MILIHHVNVLFDKSTWHFDPSLQDKVWDKIVYMIVTRDIDMNLPRTPVQSSVHELILPAPTPGNFIPFDEVDEGVVIGWIDQHDNTLLDSQDENTKALVGRNKKLYRFNVS